MYSIFCCVMCFQFIFCGVKTVHILSFSSASHILLDSGQPSICFIFLAENVVVFFFFHFYSELHVTSVLCIFDVGVLPTLTGTNIVVFFFLFWFQNCFGYGVYILINSTAVFVVKLRRNVKFLMVILKVRFCKFCFRFNFFYVQTVHILSVSAASHISLDSGQPSIYSLVENIFFVVFRLFFSLLQQVMLWFVHFPFIDIGKLDSCITTGTKIKLNYFFVLDFKICGCVVYFVPFYSSFPWWMKFAFSFEGNTNLLS